MTTTISVTPGYIGQKTSADKSNILTYSITTDGTMSDITEKINGVTIATRTNPTSGQEFTVSLTQEQWDAIKYGNAHTLTIEMGSDTWTYTFDKRLNANDDILSAVKGVQDLQTHLNGIKAQLGAAIRAKGGTVNDTDAWSAFVSAVADMQSKIWASGTATAINDGTVSFVRADGTTNNAVPRLIVNGLSFMPSTVLIVNSNPSSSAGGFTFLFPETFNLAPPLNNGRIISGGPFNGSSNSSALLVNYKLDGTASYVNNGSFQLPLYGAGTFRWFAFE